MRFFLIQKDKVVSPGFSPSLRRVRFHSNKTCVTVNKNVYYK